MLVDVEERASKSVASNSSVSISPASSGSMASSSPSAGGLVVAAASGDGGAAGRAARDMAIGGLVLTSSAPCLLRACKGDSIVRELKRRDRRGAEEDVFPQMASAGRTAAHMLPSALTQCRLPPQI